jgi:hypothetical protein
VITIIGGSHSAFSVAWMLINGPFKPPRQFEIPFDLQRQAKVVGFDNPGPPLKGPNLFGYTELNFNPNSINFKVQIIYRDKIKVYY